MSAPPQPTNLVALTADGGAVSLSWNSSATATSYTLQYKVGGFGDWMNLYIGALTSYSVSNFNIIAVVNNSVTYCFQVYATNANGNSAPSNIAEATPFNNNLPTRLWARFEPNCPSFKIEANNIAETSYDMQWSMASRNELTRKKGWASQSQTNTYPNTTNINNTPDVGLKIVNNTLTCWSIPSPIVCNSSSSSNVPGKPVILCFNNDAPFNNYRYPKTYSSGNTKWPLFSTK